MMKLNVHDYLNSTAMIVAAMIDNLFDHAWQPLFNTQTHVHEEGLSWFDVKTAGGFATIAAWMSSVFSK